MLEEFPSKLTEFLERATSKVRSMTVDRAERVVKIVSLGMITVMLALAALVLLGLAAFNALAAATDGTAAFAILGGVFVLAGALVWSRRKPKADEESK